MIKNHTSFCLTSRVVSPEITRGLKNGVLLGEKDPGTICDNGAEYCAVSVDSSELDSNGMPPFDNVEEPGASEHYIEIARKD
ncbi:hypothetical protein [Marinoscillum sp.]|uniref:hypothetical protein n=1 Tax=Marinoscillum sp. TaxID=2024838 RepID=UPI003BAC6A69